MIFISLLVILFLVFLMFLLVRFTLRSLFDIIEGLKQKEEPSYNEHIENLITLMDTIIIKNKQESFYTEYIADKDKINLN